MSVLLEGVSWMFARQGMNVPTPDFGLASPLPKDADEDCQGVDKPKPVLEGNLAEQSRRTSYEKPRKQSQRSFRNTVAYGELVASVGVVVRRFVAEI